MRKIIKIILAAIVVLAVAVYIGSEYVGAENNTTANVNNTTSNINEMQIDNDGVLMGGIIFMIGLCLLIGRKDIAKVLRQVKTALKHKK